MTDKKIIIPEGQEQIKSYEFYRRKEIVNINIPDSVKLIGHCAFADCTSLLSVSLSKNISEIRSYTFENCSNLKEIIIPDSVKSIGYCAFRGCI